jgi:hypothetical protein
MAKGYTTRQAVENYLLITIDASFYTQITTWLEQIEKYIDTVTGRNFVADTVASIKKYDGDGSNKLLIDDCIAVTKVEVDDEELDSETDDPDFPEYYTYPANSLPITRLESDSGVFVPGRKIVEVTAKWGYSAAAPADIAFAATVLLAGIINYSNDSEGEVKSMTGLRADRGHP